MTLDDLPAAFAAARAEVEASAPTAQRVPGLCPYCDDTRLVSASIGAHALCIVPASFRRQVYELWYRNAAVTQARIADACGVTIGVVGRWLRNIERIGRAA